MTKCSVCGNEFIKNRVNKKYCSRECMKEASNIRRKPVHGYFLLCVICQEEFESRHPKSKTCAKNECCHEYNRQRKEKDGNTAQAKERNKVTRNKPENKRKTRDLWLRYTFGISIETYEEMLEKQNGVCYICSKVNPSGRVLSVDHDHKTKMVRKLLCQNCNSLIGQAKEDIRVLEIVKEYLKEHDAYPTHAEPWSPSSEWSYLFTKPCDYDNQLSIC
jgi:hypothetical protein